MGRLRNIMRQGRRECFSADCSRAWLCRQPHRN